MVDKDSHRRFPIRKKLLLLAFTAAIPFLAVAVYLLVSMANYSQSYNEIVSNLTVANKYNLDFKEVMDESLYKMVVGYATFDNISENEELVNPYDKIRELREETGYAGENARVIGRVHPNPALQGNVCHTVRIDNAEKRSEPALEATECIVTEAVPLKRVEKMIRSGEISHGLVLNALMFYFYNRETV